MGSTKTGKSGKSSKSMSKKKNKLQTQLEEETVETYSPPISPTVSHPGTETGSFLGGRNMDQGGMSGPSPSLYSRKSEMGFD